MKPLLTVMIVLCVPAVLAADARMPIGKLDVWDGPFASIAEATKRDLTPAVKLSLFEDSSEDDMIPTDLPIDELVALRREVVACASERDCNERETAEYRLAAHTSAGWFMSGQLGVSENRDICHVTSVARAGSRIAIEYSCDVGRFDWASKDHLLLCGVDATGRPACGRTLVGARHNAHRGGKSDAATDVIYDTLSCGTKIDGDTVKLVPRKVKRRVGDEARHVSKLAKCGGTTRFPLGGAYVAGTHLPPPVFDWAGRWLKP
jgi:hypothetical protein